MVQIAKKGGITTPAVFLIMTLVFLIFSISFYFLYGMIADSFTDSLNPINKDTATRLMITNFLRSPVDVEKDSKQYVMEYWELISLGTTNPDWEDIMQSQLETAEKQLAFYDIIYGKKQKGDTRWGVEIIKNDDVIFEIGTPDPYLIASHRPIAANAFPLWDEFALSRLKRTTNFGGYTFKDLNEFTEEIGFFEDYLIPNPDGSLTIFRYYWRPTGVLKNKD